MNFVVLMNMNMNMNNLRVGQVHVVVSRKPSIYFINLPVLHYELCCSDKYEQC
jgi:hypothetical protein